jgi:prepilin-type N-terminal cleavage/methylation domain-containing protein
MDGPIQSFAMRRNDPIKSSGFTLAEMLVVIIIIAILVVLSFPALNLARAGAQRAACMSNLKQLVVASYSWAGDHNGWLPNYAGPTYLRYSPWYPYGLGYPLDVNFVNSYLNGDYQVLFCPSDTAFTPAAVWAQHCAGYVYYAGYPGYSSFPGSPSKITDSPRSLLWGDIQAILSDGTYYIAAHTVNGVISGANWARLDGSVQWYPLSQMELNTASPPGGVPGYYVPKDAFP